MERPRAEGGREEIHESAERLSGLDPRDDGGHAGAGREDAVVSDGAAVERAGAEDGDPVENGVVGAARAPEDAAVARLGVGLGGAVEGEGSAARRAAEERDERVENHGGRGVAP